MKYFYSLLETGRSKTNPLVEPTEEDKKFVKEVLEEIYEEIVTRILKSRQIIFDRLVKRISSLMLIVEFIY